MLKEISTQELKKITHNMSNDFIIVDVRTISEYSRENIPNSKNIPLQKLTDYIEELKKYEKVYLFCRSGNRSYTAGEILTSLGIKEPINIRGGIISWKRNGYPTSKVNSSIPFIRVMQIVMGILIMAEVTFSKSYNSELVVPALLGLFLFYSGLTNKCLFNSCSLRS